MTKLHSTNILFILLILIFFGPAIHAQPANDECETAIVMDNVISDAAFVCIEATNLDALPEDENNQCEIGTQPTVWFMVPTDGNATLMNIHVTSSDFSTPTISLFHAVQGDCFILQPVSLTQSNFPCIVGSNGEAEALASDVGSSEIYYIAISSLNSNGGTFELCVNTISVASACVIDREIEITGRSAGGSLQGPFLPGETVGVCFNVNSFTASANGCQWFQGIVPVFGNGWDPSSFDSNGQPINATINGNSIGNPGNGIYGATTWDWFSDVGYHHNNPFLQIGDIDGNGTVDMCNILYSADCPDFGGLSSGCCGPCWADPGDILPPGWFAYGINGTCATPGPPISVDWGDGNTCGCCMGPWSFCFDLTVREFPDCLEDPSTRDLTLGFFTFADGEVGAWTGGASVCALDQPAVISFPMCCGDSASDDEIFPEICGDGIVEIFLDEPGIEYWTWTVDAFNVSGASEGEGEPGTIVIDTLVNTGNEPGVVYYYFLGVGPGGCFNFERNITIDVLPPLNIELFLPVTCEVAPMNYVITSSVTGGSGDYEYLWLPGEITTPHLTIQNPVEGQVYTLIVDDNEGCIDTASIIIAFDSTLNVTITTTGNSECSVSGPVTLTGNVVGGEEPYTYVWTLPGGTMTSGQSIVADTSGWYVLSVTDLTGCDGIDSIEIAFFDSLDVYISLSDVDTTICDGEVVTLNGIANGGQPPYLFIWYTPSGIDTLPSVMSGSAGLHTLVVIDDNGCSDTTEVTLIVNDSPQIDPGLTNQEICFGDTTSFTVLVNGGTPPYDILWNTPSGEDSAQTILAFESGFYSVFVVDLSGCVDSAQVFLEVNELPDLGPDSSEIDICIGDSALIDPTVSGGEAPFDFTWDTPNGVDTSQAILTGVAGDYYVTVVDNNGCMDSALFTLSVHDLPTVDLGPDTIQTDGDVVLDAGPGFVSYVWNTGSVTQTITATPPGWISVTVTDNFGCMDVDSIYLDFSTSISNPNEKELLSIKPNPNKGIFTIEGNVERPQSCHIEVMNAIGQLIYYSPPQQVDVTFSLQVDLRYAGADVYFVKIYLGERIYQRKVVIQ